MAGVLGAGAQAATQDQTAPGGAPDVGRHTAVAQPARPPKPPRGAGDRPFDRTRSVTLTNVTVKSTVEKTDARFAARITQADVDRAVAPLLGHRSDLSVFCVARDKVARLYAHKGYRLTRVDIPPQEVKRGELVLLVTPGYIASADLSHLRRMGPTAGLAASILQPLAHPAAKDGTVTPTPWDAIERRVLLARDIPGSQIDIRLHSTPEGPGALELYAGAEKPQHFDIIAGVEDMGSKEFGQVAGYARLDANGFLPYGDRTSLLFYGTTTGAQKVGEFMHSGDIGSSGLRAEGDVTYARTEPRGQLSPLGIAGDFFDGAVKLSYPLIRGSEANLYTSVGLEIVNERNSLGALRGAAGTPLLFRDKLRVFTAGADFAFKPAAIAALDVTADFQLRQGIVGLDSSHPGDAGLSRASGDPGALVLRGNLALRYTLGGRALTEDQGGPFLQVAGAFQGTSQSLLSYEQFQIGNYTVGRGYDPGAASGDNAYGLQIDGGWPICGRLAERGWGFCPTLRNWKVTFEPYGFFDAARLENHVGYNTEVSSWGVGMRFFLPQNIRLMAAYADPLDPPFPGARRPPARLIAQLSFYKPF